MRFLVDLICLLFHEARNVRHPIKDGKLSKDQRYIKLLNLHHGRDEAWIQMSKIREKASTFKNTNEIVILFQKNYGIKINELLDLFNEPCWRNTQYGGNKWAPICSKIIELLNTMNSESSTKTAQITYDILLMDHNTGYVAKKLHELKEAQPL